LASFLVYNDDVYRNHTTGRNGLLKALHNIGDTRPANFNVLVVSAGKDAGEIHKVLAANCPENGSYFITTVQNMGYQGPAQFGAALDLIAKRACSGTE
jgi:hypothetical protein